MQRSAFKMFLNPGQAEEYRRRHDAIWPELAELLTAAGVCNYSIYLDAETDTLFAYLELGEDHMMDRLAAQPAMRRWWAHMADIMRTERGEPVVTPLDEMFHLD
jgi:L-rhamnose mutarotase